MPAKPVWIANLDNTLESIRRHPFPYIDCDTLKALLGVSRRRSQQIMAPCVTMRLGSNGLAEPNRLAEHLQTIASAGDAAAERQRRQKVARLIREMAGQRVRQPQVIVEAPTAVVNQKLETLPQGLHLSPGRIVIDHFSTPEEAKQKLLALIMAMANDPDGFDVRITPHRP